MTSASVRELFERCVDLEPEAQRALLDTLEIPEETRAAVERLLAGARGAVPALDAPVTDFAAPLLQRGGATPARLGRYRILRLLGRGGMGSVFLAEQDSPRREVAIKRLDGFDHPGAIERFRREAAVLARLSHPGIASVLEAGVDEGTPFLAMEYVEGVDLRSFAAGLSREARLELLASVCDAVEHAHARGIVHRDLKPNNILVRADGSPKVLDFGIARVLEGESTLTETGVVLGTPAYMAPEQATGGDAAIDARADVYALGAIAYELLAGRAPIPVAGLTPMQAMRAVSETTPMPLSRLHRALRGDLEVIVGKALAKDAAQRYPSAGALGDDLRRFLAHEPIRARPPTAWSRAWKFARRHPWPVASAAVAVLALVGGVAVASWFAYGERAERLRAEQAQAAAEAQRQRAESTLGFITTLLAEASPARTGRPDVAVREVVERALPRIEALPPDAQAPLLVTLADALVGYGASSAAVPLYQRALAHSSQGRPEQAAAMRVSLADALIEAGRAADARAQLLPLADQPPASVARRVHVALGIAEARLGNLRAAERHRLALAALPREGANDDLMALRLGLESLDHAASYGYAPQIVEMLPALREVAHRSVGPNHPLALRLELYEKYVAMYRKDDPGVIAAAEKAVARHREVLGEEHEGTLRARLALAGAYGFVVRNRDALRHLEALRSDARRLLPANSELRAEIDSAPLELLIGSGRAEEAIELAHEILARACTGDDGWTTTCGLLSFAHAAAHVQRREVEPALRALRRAHRNTARRVGERHLSIAWLYANAAIEFSRVGLHRVAQVHADRAARVLASVEGETEGRILQVESFIAFVHLYGRDWRPLLPVARRLHAAAVEGAPGAPYVSVATRLYATALAHLGEFDEAQRVAETGWAHVTASATIPSERMDVARALATVARLRGDRAAADRWIAEFDRLYTDDNILMARSDPDTWSAMQDFRRRHGRPPRPEPPR